MVTRFEDSKRDEIYKNPQQVIDDFEFDANVTRVFPDMIRRSVPGYETIVDLIGVLVAQNSYPEATIYDLGCSRGAVTQSILRNVEDLPCVIHAVDSSTSMIESAQGDAYDSRVAFRCQDIRDTEIHNAAAVILNLVLQFVPPEHRTDLLIKIFNGTRPDGILVLTEKIKSSKRVEQLHLQYKRSRGYSHLEIQQKRAALEAVMQIDSLNRHIQRLRAVGYRRIWTWFRCLNWASVIAYK